MSCEFITIWIFCSPYGYSAMKIENRKVKLKYLANHNVILQYKQCA